MAEGDKGKIYIGTRVIGRVYEVTDKDGKRTSRVVVDKLTQPAGVAFANGALYVIAIDKALRYDGIEDKPDVQPVDLTAKFNLPKEQHHNWKYIAFGPDKKLYVPFGAPCNICEPPTKEYAQIRRYNPDGSGMEVIATACATRRASTGTRRRVSSGSPTTAATGWATRVRGRTQPDRQGGQFLRLSVLPRESRSRPGHQEERRVQGRDAAGYHDGAACRGDGCPVLHRIDVPEGIPEHDVHRAQGLVEPHRQVRLRRRERAAVADGKSAKVTPFMTGFLEDPKEAKFWGRPAYIHQMKDGSLLVTDEQLGAIYRITYDGGKAEGGKKK
jgi:hypothetical protein